MRKALVGLAVVAACLVFASAPAMAGTIVGSAHDFSSAGWNSSGEICKPCHVPHNPNPGDQPLWNHTLTTETFTMYPATLRGTAQVAAPSTQSKLCLSCHDGVTNLDAFGGAAGSTPMGAVPGNFGTDLSEDHPISIDYGGAAKGLLATPTSPIILFSNLVECGSCHDVHNGAGVAKLLRTSNAGSDLCLACHDK